MENLSKAIFIVILAAVVAYTAFGILQLGSEGGPCNAGIAWILLFPALLICTVSLAISLFKLAKHGYESYSMPLTLTLLALLFWTFWLYTFYKDSPNKSLLYLGPFELLCIAMHIFSVWKFKNRSTAYLYDEIDNIHRI